MVGQLRDSDDVGDTDAHGRKTDTARQLRCSGIAFAGRHGISRVQVSLNDGSSWHDAAMKEPLSKWSWAVWSYDWMPAKRGKYTLKVRGIDKAGKLQESGSIFSVITRSYPDGLADYTR